jgi:Reverse transcriptase (RNA-dependent DNA polymerase)
MVNIPSKYRSEKIQLLANKHNLTDPFRFLHPYKRDFTYVPNDKRMQNRSRLDYFLISKDICNNNLISEIELCLATKAFDHKMITLFVKSSKHCTAKDSIKDHLIKNPAIRLRVRLLAAECHLHHSDPQAFPPYQKRNLLEQIGLINYKLNKVNVAGTDDKNSLSEALVLLETFPDPEFFDIIPKECDDQIFFGVLIMAIKNGVLAEQKKIFDKKNEKKERLRKRLLDLKLNFVNNNSEIFRLEKELENLVESEIRDEVSSMNIFDRLTSEKMTPYFLKLAKGCNKSECTSSIKKPCGSDFENISKNRDYISDFYENLYKKPATEKEITQEDIANFLGDVGTEPEVQNSKISEAEKTRLDADLKITELDDAINQSKKKTAPGIDGFSYSFIREFWVYFRAPLHGYALASFEKGKLSENFRTAKIRLIPKKGDITKIGNWRPISLLSCFYKLVSQAYANRLKTVIDKITNVGQKGYSKTKQCQEVLISIIEGIRKCKKNNLSGAVLSVDIKKAFDSISHGYLKEVLRFFNFGEKFIGCLMTLCTNRYASIIQDDGRTGRKFKLERGNAQGDTISPFLFNIGYQLLIIKLNYDLQITGFLDLPALSQDHQPLPAQVSRKPRRVFAFADDCTVLVVLNKDNLIKIKSFLSEFAKISGLECNIEKSFIMPVGSIPNPPLADYNDLGFRFVEEVTILGMILKGNCDNYDKNEANIIRKISRECNKWLRFNLSLPGRITVAKTMMYSQLNYLGCFLPVSANLINTAENLIVNYVSGNLKIAEKRVFDSLEQGGLGLFRIKPFLAAQCCAWVKRAENFDELWKINLYAKTPGDLHFLRKGLFNKTDEPILHHISDCFELFLQGFTKMEGNFKKSYIFNNQSFTLGLRTKRVFNQAIVGEHFWDVNKRNLMDLTFDKIATDAGMFSREQLRGTTGLELSDQLYRELSRLISAARTRYGSQVGSGSGTKTFFQNLKKGSKRFRKYLSEPVQKFIPHNIVKYSDNTETVINYSTSCKLNAEWKTYFLSNECRIFSYKLVNNILGYNIVISHFVPGADRNCTFCNLIRNPDPEDETALHLFFACRVSETLINNFFQDIVGTTVSRQEFFGFAKRENNHQNVTLYYTCLLIKKFLWDCKQWTVLPCSNWLQEYVFSELKTCTSISLTLKYSIDKCNFSLLFRTGCGGSDENF